MRRLFFDDLKVNGAVRMKGRMAGYDQSVQGLNGIHDDEAGCEDNEGPTLS